MSEKPESQDFQSEKVTSSSFVYFLVRYCLQESVMRPMLIMLLVLALVTALTVDSTDGMLFKKKFKKMGKFKVGKSEFQTLFCP